MAIPFWLGKPVAQIMSLKAARPYRLMIWLVLLPPALVKTFSTVWLQVNPLRKGPPIACYFTKYNRVVLWYVFIIKVHKQVLSLKCKRKSSHEMAPCLWIVSNPFNCSHNIWYRIIIVIRIEIPIRAYQCIKNIV